MSLDEYSRREFKQVGTRPRRPDGVDKVTGRAMYGADASAPGMLVGRILRSPHAHARIKAIDTAAAAALPGVKAVITAADFGLPDDDFIRDVQDNCMARGKALYDGHAVAAVAAVDAATAKAALKLIRVEYETLPHVTDVDAAMAPGAPVVQEGRALENVPAAMSANVTSHCEFGHGDPAAGFARADRVIERHFTTAATHQGYIEPHACLASVSADGKADLWCCTQGHFFVRTLCVGDPRDGGEPAARHRLGDRRRLRRQDHRLHRAGGAGAVSRKAGRPVKIVMSRDEVFRATGPTVSTSIEVKIGMTKDGRITAGEAHLRYSGGAFPCATVEMGGQAAFAAYDLDACPHLWLERADQPAERGGLPRAGRAAGDLCGGKRH